MKVSQMTQQTLPVRIRLLRMQCQLLQLRCRQITFVIFVGLIKEQELCLFRVAMRVSAIRVSVNCLLLPRHVASADNKLTC